mgnify:CR=1 FL=1
MTLKGVQIGDEIEVTFNARWNASRVEEVERYVVESLSPAGKTVRAARKRQEKGDPMNKLIFSTQYGNCVSWPSMISAKQVTA